MGDSSSSSSSQQQTTVNNIDRRQVIGEGAIGLASDGASVTINTVDTGIVNKALDTVANSDAVNGAGFEKLLSLADKLFTGGGQILDKTAETTMAQVAALNTAQNDAKGAIDQKTIIVLGIGVGIVVVAMAAKRRG